MWIIAKHTRIDSQGRLISTNVTVNMDHVITYLELEENSTRLFLEIGHDVEDHRTAKWIDIQESKEQIDSVMETKRIPAAG
jgi:hypothetical protein